MFDLICLEPILMFFTADRYELRYSTSRKQLEVDFSAAQVVEKAMIKGDFNLNSPKAAGETEYITVTYPALEGTESEHLTK